mmetsp:Transcript_5783/g.16676  ORF Transcript_5783/g.16676 Transcript_5783/m.16676 type:complete len:131 (-) Transcript_5783:59-451(-)|eukprot:CAMPEP_0113548740 /NCGR_PEP_ID=MMETSP0015_2-20120614/13050_1 /TAXON_ID=2838 /ORGANISM="Odontella" /LENGTH=130 /DNA_ID=CAMNT_0000449381 /DNA_START=196 /DNA_END=588 /DNA_ORIENTATION=- /assembly_acc=CAM_ASM_000160
MAKVYKFTDFDEKSEFVEAELAEIPHAYYVEDEDGGEENGCGGQAKGAAALCGLSGLVIGGPLLAIFAAAGGAHASINNKGPVGEASRAIGDVALAAGERAKESKLKEKSRDAFQSVVRSTRESLSRKKN